MRFLLLFLLFISCSVSKQMVEPSGKDIQKLTSLPEFQLNQADVKMPLQFLASDEMQGRNTGTIHADIAARFIAEQFRHSGISSLGENYYQEVDLVKITPNKVGEFEYENSVYTHGENMLLTMGNSMEGPIDFIFVEQGWVDTIAGRDDYKNLDIKGKMVVSIPGISKEGEVEFPKGLEYAFEKATFAKEKGAVGLIEIFPYGAMLWNMGKEIYSNPQVQLASTDNEGMDDRFIIGLIIPDQPEFLSKLKTQKIFKNVPFSFQNNSKKEKITSKNVVGVIKGTDSLLSKEHIILTAHYDHIGTKAAINETDIDTIFNGSRDNAMGTVALLSAAKTIGKNPPKRSIIFAAFTGEEHWFLGSKYYTSHPLIPLNETVFNLNADGTSYNNTSLVTIFGYDQFDDLTLLEKGCQPFGLTINADPAPEQNLFERSDNVLFAEKGIPAPTFSIGFDDFNDEMILNYYHQVTDNPNTIDYDYLLRYSQAFSYTARLLGNAVTLPYWKVGSDFEKMGDALYSPKENKE